MGAAISFSRSFSSRASINSSASVTDLSQKPLMLMPPTVTARLSLDSRWPWHSSQGTALI